MILVRIDLISAIDSSRDSEIGRMYIANTGDGADPKLGDYDALVCRRGSQDVPQPFDPHGPKPTRSGKVTNYPRLAYNVWRLIARAALAAFPEERNPKGTAPVLDAAVMRGLRLLSESGTISAHPDLVAAREWLDAGLDSSSEAL